MAIPLSSKPNTVPPLGAYPYGDIKDDSGANDGTPVDVQVYGDFHQFFAALMALTSTVFNGLRDNAANGFQYIAALGQYIRDIISADVSVMGVDGVSKMRVKRLNIGDWNMDANSFTTITHGIANYQNILSISVVIRPDSGGPAITHLLNAAASDTVVVSGGVGEIEATTFRLWRLTGGIFDNTNYDATSYNRGFITITYLP